MLALAFLTVLAADARPARSADPNRAARSSEPIDLTVPEIRRLLGVMLNPPSTTTRLLLAWSTWRRHHQAAARRSHYQRRIHAPSIG
jgi:hypothetical protein